MSKLQGTVVADAIVPLGANPTHYDDFGQGGFRVVATLNDRDSIPVGEGLDADGISSGKRKPMMLVAVLETQKVYQLNIPSFYTMSDEDKYAALQDDSMWVEFTVDGNGGSGESQWFEDNGSTVRPELPAFYVLDKANSESYDSSVDLPANIGPYDEGWKWIPVTNYYDEALVGFPLFGAFYNYDGSRYSYTSAAIFGVEEFYETIFDSYEILDSDGNAAGFYHFINIDKSQMTPYMDLSINVAHDYTSVRVKPAGLPYDKSRFSADDISATSFNNGTGVQEYQLSAEIQYKINRPAYAFPRIIAFGAAGSKTYEGDDLVSAINSVPEGAGTIHLFANVFLSNNVTVSPSTVINGNGNIVDMPGRVLTLSNRAQLVNIRIQRGIVKSGYNGGNDALTPLIRGGLVYGDNTTFNVEGGAYLVIENVSMTGSQAYVNGAGTVILRGSTRPFGRPTGAGVTVVDERGGGLTASDLQALQVARSRFVVYDGVNGAQGFNSFDAAFEYCQENGILGLTVKPGGLVELSGTYNMSDITLDAAGVSFLVKSGADISFNDGCSIDGATFDSQNGANMTTSNWTKPLRDVSLFGLKVNSDSPLHLYGNTQLGRVSAATSVTIYRHDMNCQVFDYDENVYVVTAVSLTSPDGALTKQVSIDNAGTLFLDDVEIQTLQNQSVKIAYNWDGVMGTDIGVQGVNRIRCKQVEYATDTTMYDVNAGELVLPLGRWLVTGYFTIQNNTTNEGYLECGVGATKPSNANAQTTVATATVALFPVNGSYLGATTLTGLLDVTEPETRVALTYYADPAGFIPRPAYGRCFVQATKLSNLPNQTNQSGL